MTYTGGMFTSEQPAGELPTIDVPVFVVMDHDRTRARVDAGVDRLLHLAARHGIDEMTVRQAQASIEADGMSFAPLGYVRDKLLPHDPASYRRLHDDFVAGGNAATELLYPGVKEFELALKRHPMIPHMILSAGVDAEWQRWKIAASGYTGYVQIIDVPPDGKTPPKGPVIASWQSHRGGYDLLVVDGSGVTHALVHADNVLLIDDKATSFSGLPEGSLGSYIHHDDVHLASQGNAMMLPKNCSISTVHNFLEIDPDIYRTGPSIQTYDSILDRFIGKEVSFVPLRRPVDD